MKRILTFLAVALVGTAAACTGSPTSPAPASHTVPAVESTAPIPGSEEEQEKEQKGGGSMAVSGG